MLSRLAFWLTLSVCAASACSRGAGSGEATEDDFAAMVSRGNDAAIGKVRAGAHALAQPEASLDYVAAQMEGVIRARTQSQALMYYDGYRVTLTTPKDRVTRITFTLIEAKPTMGQLDAVFGEPKQVNKGMLYEYDSPTTGSKLLILAEPVSTPANEGSLVRSIVIEGAPIR